MRRINGTVDMLELFTGSANRDRPQSAKDTAVSTIQLLIDSTQKRADMGKAKYGVYLTARNGRNPLVDAFQEALDQLVYLRQAIEDGEAMPPIHPDYATRPEPAPAHQADLTPIFQLVIADLEMMANGGAFHTVYYQSSLHYIYYSAIHNALRIQRELTLRMAKQSEGSHAEQDRAA